MRTGKNTKELVTINEVPLLTTLLPRESELLFRVKSAKVGVGEALDLAD